MFVQLLCKFDTQKRISMIKRAIIRICEFTIIMCKNTIASIETMSAIKSMNASFNSKIKKK